jgi:superfamily II DNA or RNA helicase/HKD family nuclease
VRDEQHREAQPPALLQALLQDLPLDDHVERGRRLVEDYERGLERERDGDPDPLAHSARELVWEAPKRVHRASAPRVSCARPTEAEMGSWRRARIAPGIYDEIISVRLDAELRELDASRFEVVRETLSSSTVITSPVATLLKSAVDLSLEELAGHEDRAERNVALARSVLAALAQHSPRVFRDGELDISLERLLSVVPKPSVKVARPRGSLHTSSLLVNAEGDSLLEHLRSEFESADRVDLLCAFVKLSGFEKLRSAIEKHCVSRGRPLRVLTTTYMGASDALAIERFAKLTNASVRVSYDDQTTRLHAKAWVFHRDSGVSTAYVGSSNLSHAAQTDGLEWNVRVTESDQPALVAQMQETFEQYWADVALFEPYDPGSEIHRKRLKRSLAASSGFPDSALLLELEPKDFQKPVLDELAAARRLGRNRNLLVAATGTGKTVMAALDYRRLREAHAVDTLLFVAHRREILEQALLIYRAALQSNTFGELLYAGREIDAGRHVFASIDSIRDDSRLDPSRFDMVVIDEAHHSAAGKWTRLLDRIQPKELLGLTGTPERADALDYECYFPRPWVGNLRLWNAIPHALVPFRYYMLDVEGVDLRDVAWSIGGYAPDALAGKLIGSAEIFVRRAVEAVAEFIARPNDLRAIAFCANIRHAEEVDRHLRSQGLRSKVLTGQTDSAERAQSKSDLNLGALQVLCVVDIYNEGIDVPNVNTLFFFRPTESATVFLQQLGRGLRRARNKSELVVFDLSGRQHHQFRFDRRLREMLGHTPRELREFVSHGFGRLPAGCHFHLDEVARDDVLDQLNRSIPDDVADLKALLREPAHSSLSLERFLHETEIDLDLLYRNKRSWTELRRGVGLERRQLATEEEAALANVPKLTQVGDGVRLDVWERLLRLERPASEFEERVRNMLFAVLYGREAAATEVSWASWESHRLLREELAAVVPILRRRNAILAPPHRLAPEIPLVLHARYLGVELSAAFDQRARSGAFREFYTGVETVADGRFDLLLVTLDKTAAQKEHLRYRDFPLSERSFHWQSKARTTRTSREGQRHLAPKVQNCTPLLFVRERADDRPGITMAFRYLGPVQPHGSEGERPITIEWDLEYAMPMELLRKGRVAA